MTRNDRLLELEKKLSTALIKEGVSFGGNVKYSFDAKQAVDVLFEMLDIMKDDARYWRATAKGWGPGLWEELDEY